MPSPKSLQDLYIDELKDLWSANDQMARCLKKILPKVSDTNLEEMLSRSVDGIDQHTALLKELIATNGEKAAKEHCKGMEGLAAEAIKHTIKDGLKKGPVMDALVIAQYQRMTHYGIAGFGTVAAYASALDLKDDHQKLSAVTKGIYGADEFMTQLAETVVNLKAG